MNKNQEKDLFIKNEGNEYRFSKELSEYFSWCELFGEYREGMLRELERLAKEYEKDDPLHDRIDDFYMVSYIGDRLEALVEKKYPQMDYFIFGSQKGNEHEKEFSDFIKPLKKKISNTYIKEGDAYMASAELKEQLLAERYNSGGNVGVFVHSLPEFLLVESIAAVQNYAAEKSIEREGKRVFDRIMKGNGITSGTDYELYLFWHDMMPKACETVEKIVCDCLDDFLKSLEVYEVFDYSKIPDEHKMIPGRFGMTKALERSERIMKSASNSIKSISEALCVAPYNVNAYTLMVDKNGDIELVKKCAKFFDYRGPWGDVDLSISKYIESKDNYSAEINRIDKELQELNDELNSIGKIHFFRISELRDKIEKKEKERVEEWNKMPVLSWRRKNLL